MQYDRRLHDYDAHFAALRKQDSVTLMQRGRQERSRTLRVLLRQAGRALRALASRMMAALMHRLRRAELARYDERLLRDMGISEYDIQPPRRIGMISTWRNRSRERRRLAGFTERDLHDIAISKCEAQTEIEKPFWRP